MGWRLLRLVWCFCPAHQLLRVGRATLGQYPEWISDRLFPQSEDDTFELWESDLGYSDGSQGLSLCSYETQLRLRVQGANHCSYSGGREGCSSGC